MADDVFGIVGTVQGGAFRVEQVVAEGGFAVVYRAYHSAFRSSVALKCLKIPRTLTKEQQDEFLEKFREEAELLFRLSASIPSVVRPLHVGTLSTGDRWFVPFIALEWLEGETLDHVVTSRAMEGRPPLELRAMVKLLTPVAEALARAHRFETPSGETVAIVHRDLKPENVFIAKINGRDFAKILDFGIAKVKSAASQIAGRQSAHESAISAFTPAYGAPEQWFPKRFGQTGAWTDVWGLAITAVEALAGHAPFDGDHAAIMAAAIDPEHRPTPGANGVSVPPEVERAFARALAVDPRERHHDVAEFWNVLCRAVGLPPITADSRSLPPGAPPPVADARAPSHEVPDLVVAAKPAPRSAKGGAGAARRAPPPSLDFDDDLMGGHLAPPRVPVIGLGHQEPAPSRPRARLAAPIARFSHRPGARLSLGGPLRILGVAVVLMAGDWVYASVTGEILRVGPARMLWVAGPIAAFGLYKLVSSLLAAAD